jgi:hypothetical protein
MTGYVDLEVFVILSGAQRQSKDAGRPEFGAYQCPSRL